MQGRKVQGSRLQVDVPGGGRLLLSHTHALGRLWFGLGSRGAKHAPSHSIRAGQVDKHDEEVRIA